MHWASRLSGTRTDGPDSFVPALNLSPEDRFGTALPLFHVYGQAVVLNTCLGNGCLRPRGFGPVDFAELRLATSGGPRCRWGVIRAFSATFDCILLECYGLAESRIPPSTMSSWPVTYLA